MEEPLQSQTPQPPESCSSPGLAGKSCWNLDFKVAVLLVTLAGAVILLLLYKLLQMWHRLKLARAIHALEYNSFYHSATYTLPQLTPFQDITIKNGTIPEDNSPIQTITAVTPPVVTPALPATLTVNPITLPLPPSPSFHPQHSCPSTPRALSLPIPLPVIHTSPNLSWGACSDADVYSRIGAFRPSRVSSLSGQSTVILFEHSSL